MVRFLGDRRQALPRRPSASEQAFIYGKRDFSYPELCRHKGTRIRKPGDRTGGIVSLLHPEWTSIMAIVGGLYFGLAGSLHLFKKLDSGNEIIALVSDLFIFIIMAAYVLYLFL